MPFMNICRLPRLSGCCSHTMQKSGHTVSQAAQLMQSSILYSGKYPCREPLRSFSTLFAVTFRIPPNSCVSYPRTGCILAKAAWSISPVPFPKERNWTSLYPLSKVRKFGSTRWGSFFSKVLRITRRMSFGSRKLQIRNKAPSIAVLTLVFSSTAIRSASTAASVPCVMFRSAATSARFRAVFTSTVPSDRKPLITSIVLYNAA
ncbi:hypothetical protein D3C80_1421650 [compost metagenome]